MRKNYETVALDFEYFDNQDVMDVSAPIGDKNDGTIGDIYGDLL